MENDNLNALGKKRIVILDDENGPRQTNPKENLTKTHKPRGKLLVLDDEEGVREAMRVIFENDYDLFMAGDGPTAIRLAQENNVDVAVLDIRIAGISGLEVLEQLKILKPDVEVITMSGYKADDCKRESLHLGACGYINKPFGLAEIRAAVSKAMRQT
jgi:DNA-binding NtrC family response regulator